jgi:hypothetical protein
MVVKVGMRQVFPEYLDLFYQFSFYIMFSFHPGLVQDVL